MGAIDCDGFELIFYPSFYECLDEFQHLPPSSQERLISLHTEKSIGPLLGSSSKSNIQMGLDRLQINARLAQHLNIERLILHLWGLPDSDEHIERNLAQLDAAFEIANDSSVTLTIESIPCVRHTPSSHLRFIADTHPNSRFTLDTEFLAMHDEISTAMEDLSILGRTDEIHIKDFNGSLIDSNGKRIYLHPGEGTIDFGYVCKKASSLPQIIDLCLESTSVEANGSVNISQVQRDLDFIGDAARVATQREQG